ncbi:MAG: ECF transporter S component [Halanaerobiales bacterium]|nr:ECF transporter S component [Halanaerobiales bacterium]
MKNQTQKLVWASFLLVLGIILPRLVNLTGSMTLGNLISPMHIPVFLTGLILGPFYGTLVGFITPLFSTLLFAMPPMMPPIAVLMAFELAAFGLISGYLYSNKFKNIYLSLIAAMILGRAVYGLALIAVGPIFNFNPPFIPFMQGAFLTGIPGMVIQLVIIPPIVEKIKPIKEFTEFNRKVK